MGVEGVLDCHLSSGLLREIVDPGEADRHRSIVSSIDAGKPGFKVFAGCVGDVEVARSRVHFRHAFPAYCQRHISISAGYRHSRCQNCGAASSPTSLDAYIIYGIKTEIVSDLGFAQQLVLKSVGQLTARPEVD